MKYVVLGGAGAMGKITVRDLYETAPAEHEIIIADYDLKKAEELALSFNSKRVKALKVDVKNQAEAVKILKGASVIINSVQYQYNLDVMKIALGVGAHYIDLGGLFHETRKQLGLHEDFQKAGLTALLGIGCAPGITNIMAAHAADSLDTVSEIHIKLGSVDQTKYKPKPVLGVSYSLKTIMEEFSFPPAVFSKGKFKFVKPMSGADSHRFPAPVGVQYPMYTIHSEVATLPLSYQDKGIKEVSFKIAFSPEFTGQVKFLRDLGLASHEPIDIFGVKVAPIDLVNKVAMSQPVSQQIGDLKQYAVSRSIVKGTKDQRKVTFIVDCHTQGIPEWQLGSDIDTGCPPSIAAQMLLNGQIKLRGTLAPEKAIPSGLFFAELEKRKMKITVTEKKGWSFAS